MILNPGFVAPAGLQGSEHNANGGLEATWQLMPFWQPPLNTNLATGIGTADFYPTHRSPLYSAHTGKNEYIVGEVPGGLTMGHLYYFSARTISPNPEDRKLDVFFSQNRSRQGGSKFPIHFQQSDNVIITQASATTPELGEDWQRMISTFPADESGCDRITLGVMAPAGQGGNEESVLANDIIFDDLKLIDLGPGGMCPEVRLVQNMNFEDEVIIYKASETITAGTDVGSTYTNTGSVRVGGTSRITFRAGEEIQLLDGFGVDAGAVFHAFIAPCDCDPLSADAGESIEVCDIATHGAVQLGVPPAPAVTYLWTSFPSDGVQYLSDVTLSNPFLIPTSQYGASYTFTLTATNVCQESVSDILAVTYIAIPDNTPDLSVDFYLSNNILDIMITPDPEAFEIIIEYRVSGNPIPTSYTLTVLEDFEINTPFLWTMPELLTGCVDHDIRVRLRNICSNEWAVEQQIFPQSILSPGILSHLYNVLTPNEDGLNDFIVLEHDNGFYYYDLIVFDRHEDNLRTVLYHSEGIPAASPMNLWDGTGQTNAVTYFFILKLFRCDGTVQEETGFWTLLGNSSDGKLESPNGEDELDVHHGREPGDLTHPNSIKPENLIRIIPNPNSGSFTIEGGDIEQVQLLESSGKLVLQLNAKGRGNVRVEGLSPGLYIIRVQMADGSVENAKVIVN